MGTANGFHFIMRVIRKKADKKTEKTSRNDVIAL